MAFSTTDRIFTLERTEIGFFPYKEKEAPLSGEVIKLHIPRLMPEITMAEPAESKIPSNGTSVFKNDPSCSIKADTTMTSINYLSVKFQGNTKWVSKEAKIDPIKGTRLIKKGLKVTVHAESNVVKDMTFTNS